MDRLLRHALAGLAANPAAPPDVLLRLAAATEVAGDLARRPDLPDAVVRRLLLTDAPAFEAARGRSALSVELWRELLADPDPRVREAAAT